MAGRLFIISGSSGVGKGTLIKKFLEKSENIQISVSTTTRKPRPGEIHGQNYFYVSKEEFTNSIKNEEFLEWAEYGDNYYGTNRKIVQEVLDKGINVLLEIEVQGAKQVKEKIPEAVTIFILPPSPEELEKRLRGRGTESEDAIRKRMRVIEFETKESENYDYKIVNETIEVAVAEIEKIYKINKG